jgi:hypothetical protein
MDVPIGQDADAASPEACAKTCSADVQCSFFSLNLGVACNKYNVTWLHVVVCHNCVIIMFFKLLNLAPC